MRTLDEKPDDVSPARWEAVLFLERIHKEARQLEHEEARKIASDFLLGGLMHKIDGVFQRGNLGELGGLFTALSEAMKRSEEMKKEKGP
jgi:hypothetical protein